MKEVVTSFAYRDTANWVLKSLGNSFMHERASHTSLVYNPLVKIEKNDFDALFKNS